MASSALSGLKVLPCQPVAKRQSVHHVRHCGSSWHPSAVLHRSCLHVHKRNGGVLCTAAPPDQQPTPLVEPPSTASSLPGEQGSVNSSSNENEWAQRFRALAKTIGDNRRAITIAVAVADVAFVWLAIKVFKNWQEGS